MLKVEIPPLEFLPGCGTERSNNIGFSCNFPVSYTFCVQCSVCQKNNNLHVTVPVTKKKKPSIQKSHKITKALHLFYILFTFSLLLGLFYLFNYISTNICNLVDKHTLTSLKKKYKRVSKDQEKAR